MTTEQTILRTQSLHYEIVGLVSASYRFDLVQDCPSEEEPRYQVLVKNCKPEHTICREYTSLVLAAAEFERQYHEHVGWYHGLDAGFVAANDHQANGQRDRIEHEEMLYNLNRDIAF